MNWRDLKIGTKLTIGFGCMLALIIIGSLVGYNGINVMSKSLHTVGGEEAPIVDSANEMKLSLMQAQNLMEQYRSATNVTGSVNESAIESIVSQYEKSLEYFDVLVDAIVNGGRVGDILVIKTDNLELAALVEETDQIHNDKFQPAADIMMQKGHHLLRNGVLADDAMLAMEDAFDLVIELSDEAETDIKLKVDKAVVGDVSVMSLKRTITELVPIIDVMMELKNTIRESRIKLEEVAQMTAIEDIESLTSDYKQTIIDFDKMVVAALKGGNVDGSKIFPIADPEVRDDVEQLDLAHAEFQIAADAVIKTRTELINSMHEAADAMSNLDLVGKQAAELLSSVGTMASDEMAAAMQRGEESEQSAIWTLIIVSLISIGVGTVAGTLINRSVSKPIGEALSVCNEIAAGNLNIQIEASSNDEVGLLQKSLSNMVDNLNKTIKHIRESSQAQAAASHELAAITEQTGRNVVEQHEATDQVATAINEMSATIRDVSINTQSAASEANNAKSKVGNGEEVVKSTQSEAEKLLQQMNVTMEKIQNLADGAANIGGILDVIKGIADQTNLLALNAAIEAARAGEQGRGFAVVADEVRSLAQSTQDSTGEIEGMIRKLQAEANESISAMKVGVENSTSMQSQTIELGEVFANIRSSVDSIFDMTAQIASASEEQSAVAEEINSSAILISSRAEETGQGSRQIAVSSEKLATLASEQEELVKQFRTK